MNQVSEKIDNQVSKKRGWSLKNILLGLGLLFVGYILVLLWLRMGIIDRKLTCVVNSIPVLEALISPEVAKKTGQATLNKQIDMIGLTCDNTFIFSGFPK